MRLSKLALLTPLLFSINSISQTFPNDGYARPYKPITPAPIFIQGPPDQANMLIRQLSKGKNSTYILPATPSTTNWGYFDAGAPPALTIKSGDTVIIETLPAGGGQVAPGITEAQIDSINNDPMFPGRGPHTLTGPIAVAGAKIGDVVAVHINKIRMRSYATNNSAAKAGLFYDKFEARVDSYYLDNDKMEMQFEHNIVVPLAPFPGILAVARSKEEQLLPYTKVDSFNEKNPPSPRNSGWCVKMSGSLAGTIGCDSKQPGAYGGNLDLREMTVGTTTYLPVFVDGAYIWTGDSHAAQGNGEIDLDALETAFSELNVTVTLIKKDERKEFGVWPIIETPKSWITIGYDLNLNQALENLKIETLRFIQASRKVSKAEAEKIMMKHWDCPISEVVNDVLGTYCMLPKQVNAGRAADIPKEDNTKFWVSYASDPADLMAAMKAASMKSIVKMSKNLSISEDRAYRLATFVMDCRIGRPKSGLYDVSCMVPKSILRKGA
jgi:acetamidase/formamidase